MTDFSHLEALTRRLENEKRKLDAAALIDAQRGYMLNAMIALQAGGTKSEAIGILQSGLKIGDE
jgi:hypothetical protein